jgi:hypothetical protein
MTGQSGVLWDSKMDDVMKLACVRAGCGIVGVDLRLKDEPAA